MDTAKYILCVVLALLILGIFLMNEYGASHAEKYESCDKIKDDSDINGNIKIYLYRSETCPACRDFKPVWDLMLPKFNEKNIKYYDIECSKGDCTGIEYIPTIIVEKNGTRAEYKGARNYESLIKFIDSL